MHMKTCPQCREVIERDKKVCPTCGAGKKTWVDTLKKEGCLFPLMVLILLAICQAIIALAISSGIGG